MYENGPVVSKTAVPGWVRQRLLPNHTLLGFYVNFVALFGPGSSGVIKDSQVEMAHKMGLSIVQFRIHYMRLIRAGVIKREKAGVNMNQGYVTRIVTEAPEDN